MQTLQVYPPACCCWTPSAAVRQCKLAAQYLFWLALKDLVALPESSTVLTSCYSRALTEPETLFSIDICILCGSGPFRILVIDLT